MKTIIIAGITRSGLTLTMQMLHAGGYPCLGTYPAFENYLIGDIPWNETEGKAVKLVDTHVQFPKPGDYKVIRLKRDLTQQSKSQVKFLKYFGFPLPKSAYKDFLKSLPNDYKKIDSWAKKQSELITISFEDIINNPDEVINNLVDFIGVDLDKSKMKSVIIKRNSDCYNGLLELTMLDSK